jgi:fumarate reductase subunit C
MVQILCDAAGGAMSESPVYSEYHPRWYRRRVSTYWWLQRGSYLVFILRELSSAFIAWFVVFTLLQIHAVSRGPENYQRFLALCQHPVILVVNIVALVFVLIHSITWFNLAPKAMVVRLRGQRVPPVWIVASNYGLWALVSAVVAWIILGA